MNAWRNHFGVDTGDESFYVAMAYRFALGDRPFIDEFALQQGAAVLTYPIIKAFYWVVGSLEGVMLFTRYLHLGFTVLTAVFVFLVLRKHLDPAVALLAAAPCIGFVPFNMHNLSYNTLGSGFLTIGLLLGFLSTLHARKNTCLLFSAMFLSLASGAHPALIVPAAVAAIVLWREHSEKKRALLLAFCAGSLLVLGGFSWFLIPAASEELIRDLVGASVHGATRVTAEARLSSAADVAQWVAADPGWGKLARVVLRYLEWFPNSGVLAKVLFLGVLLGLRRNAAWSRYGLLATPLLMVPEYSYVGGMHFVRNYALLAPFLLYFLRQDRLARRLFSLVWLPAFVASLAVSWSSANGAYAAAVGFFPGSLVTTVYLVLLARAWLRRFQLLPAVWPNLALVACVGAVLHDDPIGDLNARVVAGPYRGIFTTSVNEAQLEQLRRDIAEVYQPDLRILYLYSSSAAYLFSDMRPATHRVLLHSPAMVPGFNTRITLDYYARSGIAPDVAILAKKLLVGKTHHTGPVEVWYSPDDPLYRMVTGPGYRLAMERDFYRVFVRE